MKIIAIDYQHDFAAPTGRWYQDRPCQRFIPETLVPWLRDRQMKLSEIISDYRLPRPSEKEPYCIPGSAGYQSLIPVDLVAGARWIKSMNSPAWRRQNGGEPSLKPGIPFADPDGLSAWFEAQLGAPGEHDIVLLGLTLDCCVLCTAQELYFRGYKARYLYEGVDTYSGTTAEKDAMFKTPLPMWGTPITFEQLSVNS